MALFLQLGRAAVGVLAVSALGKGLDFSTDGSQHELATYVGFYGAAALFALATAAFTIAIHRNKQAETAAGSRSRPLRWKDLATMRVPTEQNADEAERLAKRGARHVYAELDANWKRLNDALHNGYWWNVGLDNLQSNEWEVSRDFIADEAPSVYDAVAPVYVLVEAMNVQANNHAQGGLDHFEDEVAGETSTSTVANQTCPPSPEGLLRDGLRDHPFSRSA